MGGMKKREKLTLCIFIDALGWQILRNNRRFLRRSMPFRKSLRTILGYSSACDPSIVSGLFPSQHKLWSSYYYDKKNSPFKSLKLLRYLPQKLNDSARFRGILSRYVKQWLKFTGYFQLYQMPFTWIDQYDYAEKDRFWGEGFLPKGKTLFNLLDEAKRPYYVGDEAASEQEQFDSIEKLMGKVDFAYILLGQLDALMHSEGTQSSKVSSLLDAYDAKILSLIHDAQAHYKQVDLYCFSDHGMHDVTESVDLQTQLKEEGFEFGKDYIACFDSTMARFWPLKNNIEPKLLAFLKKSKEGQVLTDHTLQSLGVYFKDHQYGKLIFLMHKGKIIVPSHMGAKPIAGMHGYEPTDPDSLAMICSNRSLPAKMESIEQIFWLLAHSLGLKVPDLKGALAYRSRLNPDDLSEC